MIETIFRIRCDGCKRASGAHVANNHEYAVKALREQGWETAEKMKHFCPECVKGEENHESMDIEPKQ